MKILICYMHCSQTYKTAKENYEKLSTGLLQQFQMYC